MDQVDLIEAFNKDLQLRGVTTSPTYVRWVKNFAQFYGGDLTKVGKEDLKKYLGHLKERKLRENSIKYIFACLSAFFDYLVEEGTIVLNPVISLRKTYITPNRKARSRERQIISIEDASKLVNSILDIRDRTIVTLLLKTGMRRHELVDLDVSDVDMEEMTITLKETPKRTNLTVFFDPETKELLRIWLSYRQTRVKSGETALFVSQYGSRISGVSIGILVEKHAERVGLHDSKSKDPKARFTPHCTRHFFSTQLLESGMPGQYVMELRGDAPAGAIDIYNHINRKKLKESYLAHIPRLGIW
jgi:integrase/recombinase XerD